MNSLGILKVYTGQGFSTQGMGMDILKEYDDVKKLYQTAKEITGINVEKLCREGTKEEQTNTRNQQAMVYVNIAALILRTEGLLFEKNEIWHCPEYEENKDLRKTYYLGFSLGEILALLAAKRFSFVDGLKLIKTRSELMARENKGELVSAIGGNESDISKNIIGKEVYLSMIKSDGNISLGGYKTPLDVACEELRAQGHIRKIIRTEGAAAAFHTPLFEQEGYELREFLMKHSDLLVPSDKTVISNLDGKPFTGSVEDTINRISQQIYKTVQFKRAVKSVEDSIGEVQVIGPGAETMAKIVKTNIPITPVYTIEKMESLNKYWEEQMRRMHAA